MLCFFSCFVFIDKQSREQSTQAGETAKKKTISKIFSIKNLLELSASGVQNLLMLMIGVLILITHGMRYPNWGRFTWDS